MSDERKLFEADNNGPDLRLTTASYPGNPYRYVYLRERQGGAWESVGSVELHPALGVKVTGRFDGWGVIAKWSGTYGLRRVHHHRLVADADDGRLTVKREQRTDQKSMYPGDERETGEWTAVEGWRIRPDGVDQWEGA